MTDLTISREALTRAVAELQAALDAFVPTDAALRRVVDASNELRAAHDVILRRALERALKARTVPA